MTSPAPAADLAAARDLLRRFPIVDGHNDLPWALREAGASGADLADISGSVEFTHTDLPRLDQGGVGGQFWSVFVPAKLAGDAAVAATIEQVDVVHRLVRQHPDAMELALTAEHAERAMAAGKVACLIGAEGGHSIASSLPVLRALFGLGVRYMTLTHNKNTPWADSATDDPAAGGLTAFGREVVREMQRLGMLVDLSHVAATTMADALDTAEGPVIFSHSSARAICDHPRNVPDEILARLPGNGGVCMVTFVPSFVSQACRDWEQAASAEMAAHGTDLRDSYGFDQLDPQWLAAHPRPEASVTDVADHLDHVREVAGVDHIGLGGDYDGVDRQPDGLGDVSTYPVVIAALRERGWSDADCGALTSGNILRVLHEAERVAARLASERGPSAATIDDLDRATAEA